MIEDITIEPKISQYDGLTRRPKKDAKELSDLIADIYNKVIENGDQALIKFTERFDNCKLESPILLKSEIDIAGSLISKELKTAIENAKYNIAKFHSAQLTPPITLQVVEGVDCMQKSVGIEKVGIYIPGGTAPLFSTVLMLAIPALLAGCKEVVLCTPPNSKGEIHPAILWTAQLCEITQIYKVGGAQAIAAMAVGTESIPKVDKIFGPGNQFVTAAKAYAQRFGVAMDMPAGPSELLVYADNTCVPKFVAADLLSQAEHGIDSQVILVASNTQIVDDVNSELNIQLEVLPRKEIAMEALRNSKSIVIENPTDAFEYINMYAPEHLIIASEDAIDLMEKVTNAGSVFLGNYCPESAGDYASGTNHTLPTDGWAKSYSGVNVDSFSRKITFQNITKKGIQRLGSTIITMAENENLQAHANAVKVRLDNLENSNR